MPGPVVLKALQTYFLCSHKYFIQEAQPLIDEDGPFGLCDLRQGLLVEQ